VATGEPRLVHCLPGELFYKIFLPLRLVLLSSTPATFLDRTACSFRTQLPSWLIPPPSSARDATRLRGRRADCCVCIHCTRRTDAYKREHAALRCAPDVYGERPRSLCLNIACPHRAFSSILWTTDMGCLCHSGSNASNMLSENGGLPYQYL